MLITHPITMSELTKEQQVFEPPEEFKKNAWIKDESVYEEGKDYRSFWAKRAEEMVDWYENGMRRSSKTLRITNGLLVES